MFRTYACYSGFEHNIIGGYGGDYYGGGYGGYGRSVSVFQIYCV